MCSWLLSCSGLNWDGSSDKSLPFSFFDSIMFGLVDEHAIGFGNRLLIDVGLSWKGKERHELYAYA